MCLLDKKNLISVIVPVYKVEKYLRECIDSILAQTYTNFECIIVDDGSPDSCPAICDEYAIRDSRVRVIHQVNKGVSTARNVALDSAAGEWIMFVDGDDFIDAEMLDYMLRVAQTHFADVVACSFVSFLDGHIPIPRTKNCEENGNVFVYEGYNEAISEYIKRGSRMIFGVSSAFKLYSAQIFNVGEILRFDSKLCYAEDRDLVFKILHRSKRTVCVADKLYYCRLRAGSATDGGLGRSSDGRISDAFVYLTSVRYLLSIGYSAKELENYIAHIVKFLINTRYILDENNAPVFYYDTFNEIYGKFYDYIIENKILIFYRPILHLFNKNPRLLWNIGFSIVYKIRKIYIRIRLNNI